MTSPTVHIITIDGIDVTSYVHQLRFSKDAKQPVKNGMIRFSRKLDSIFSVINTVVSKSITIQRGTTERYIFRGEIVSYQQVGSFYEMTYADKLYGCVKREVDYTYDRNIDTEAGVGSEIVKDILSVGGVPYNNDSVPTTGTNELLLLNIYPAKGAGIESLKDLAAVYNRQLYYMDSEDLAYFIPYGNITTTTILTTGTDIVGKIQWNNTAEDMSNSITVIGGKQLDWNTETFNATAAQTTFTLGAKPVDTDVKVDTIRKNRGVNSSAPNDFYVLEDQKQLIFTVAMSGGESVVIGYSYNIPVKVTSSNSESIDDYTQRDKTFNNEKLTNTDDAELNANNLLEAQSELLTSAPINVIENNDLEVGQLITVVDTVNSITKPVIVQSVEYRYPYKADKLMVGKIPISSVDINLSILTNIARLQQQLTTDSDINLALVSNTKTIEVSGYTKVETSYPDSEALYWDDAVQGNWDDYLWGDAGIETYTVKTLIPFNKTIHEDFRGTEFKGATTTATWTTTGSCAFTNGQIAVSTLCALGSTITAASLTADNSTNLIFAVSTNGSTWETVLSGTEKTLTYPNTSLYWKATASGVATLNKIMIAYR